MAENDKQVRVVLLCGDGLYQRDLALGLARRHSLVGIVKVCEPQVRGSLKARITRYLNPARLVRYLIARIHQKTSTKSAEALLQQLFYNANAPPEFPNDVALVTVPSINHPEAVSFVEQLQPDIVCVNGTNLLREPMLALAAKIPYGIINLHTGLSPYTRGGNCNLYALLEGQPEWVGVTIHHIDAGIDSGDLIKTAQVPMDQDDLFDHIDVRTFRLGNDLLIQAVTDIAAGRLVRVKQWEHGKLFLKRTGYVYEPWHWYQVNKRLKNGLLRQYLAAPPGERPSVRLVG